MTHEQIEKAAQEFWDDWLLVQQKADEYSALEIPFDEADEMYRLWKEGLTRFSQQCEADALERAAESFRSKVFSGAYTWDQSYAVLVAEAAQIRKEHNL